MLLPSALPCEARAVSTRPSRIVPQSLLLTPPPSDEESSSPLNNGLYNTCKALQSMLMTQPTPRPKHPQSRQAGCASLASPISFVHPTAQPRPQPTPQKTVPRGANKRRRSLDDKDLSDEDGSADEQTQRFCTPKRQRLAPISMPRGLDQSDFDALEPQSQSDQDDSEQDDLWTTEDDRILIEIVLEKLKLSESDWLDCARSLGKRKGSAGRRWQSLMEDGSIGLRKPRGHPRPRIDTQMRV